MLLVKEWLSLVGEDYSLGPSLRICVEEADELNLVGMMDVPARLYSHPLI